MHRLIIVGFCLRLISSLAYKMDIVRDVEERFNWQTGEYEIIRILPKGERLTNLNELEKKESSKIVLDDHS